LVSSSRAFVVFAGHDFDFHGCSLLYLHGQLSWLQNITISTMKKILIPILAIPLSFYLVSCEAPTLTPDKCIACTDPVSGEAEEVCVEGTLINTKKRIDEAKAQWEQLGFVCSESYNKSIT
jgi:hypothetical protein